jgi:hypothetical protein
MASRMSLFLSVPEVCGALWYDVRAVADLCLGGSAATTIELTKEAAEAGATHSIVICPGKIRSPMYRDVC